VHGLGRVRKDAGPVERGDRGRPGHPVPQLDGPFEMAGRVGEGVHPLGRQPGLDRGWQGMLEVECGVPVVGQLGGDRRLGAIGPVRVVRDGRGQIGMQPDPLPRQKLGLYRFTHERVPEGQGPAIGVGEQYMLGHRLAHRIGELRPRKAAGDFEKPVIDPATGRGRRGQHRLGRPGQPLDPGQQGVPQRSRQARRLAPAPSGQQLLRVEGVAVRSHEDVVDEPGRGRRLQDRIELGGQLGPSERAEVNAFDAVVAAELGQQRSQRMAAHQLVGPVGQDQQQPLVPQPPRQEHHQVTGRAVGPVEILEHEDQRRLATESAEQVQKHLKQPGLRDAVVRPGSRVRSGQLGQQPAQLVPGHADQRVQRARIH